MSRKWLAVLLIGFGLCFLTALAAGPVRAQGAVVENDANCVSCHEHQYYMYDNGKYFCLCEAPMHCVYCHNGRTDSYTKEVAHEGLVLYPTQNEAESCQSCHGADAMARVVTFDEIAGIGSEPIPVITATPAAQAAAPVQSPPVPPLLHLGQMEPWRQGFLIIVGFALVSVLFIGYRCWITDCQAKLLP
jgi:hypothetical protein